MAIQGSYCQASLINNAVFPSLTSQNLCLWMRLLFSCGDFQMLEPWMFSSNLISSCFGHWGVYLLCHSFPHGSSLWDIHFHHILSPITLFISKGSLSPKPPTSLGLQMVFQSTNGHFLCPSVLPQRKVLWIFLICFITDLGASRTEKRYKGIACSTNFTRVSLLGRLRALNVHWLSFCLILSSNSFHEICLCWNPLTVHLNT